MSRRARTPAHGVPSSEFDDEQPTPPPHNIEELERRLWPLRKAGDQLIDLSSRVERLTIRVDGLERLSGNISDAAEIREEVMSHVIDIKGQSGNNGKLGTLTKRVDELAVKVKEDAAATTGHNRWMIGLAIPLIVAIAGGALAMWAGTKAVGRDVEFLRQAQGRTDVRIDAVNAKLDALVEALIKKGNP